MWEPTKQTRNKTKLHKLYTCVNFSVFKLNCLGLFLPHSSELHPSAPSATLPAVHPGGAQYCARMCNSNTSTDPPPLNRVSSANKQALMTLSNQIQTHQLLLVTAGHPETCFYRLVLNLMNFLQVLSHLTCVVFSFNTDNSSDIQQNIIIIIIVLHASTETGFWPLY